MAPALRHVWMPALGVWARAPEPAADAPATEEVQQRARSRKHPRPDPSLPKCDQARRDEAEHPEQPAAKLASPPPCGSPDRTSEGDELPQCPICLADVDLQSKAIVAECFHIFCLSCIHRWLELKRSCPMCKRRVTSVLYDIVSDDRFKERAVPPSPPCARREDASGSRARLLRRRRQRRRRRWRGPALGPTSGAYSSTCTPATGSPTRTMARCARKARQRRSGGACTSAGSGRHLAACPHTRARPPTGVRGSAGSRSGWSGSSGACCAATTSPSSGGSSPAWSRRTAWAQRSRHSRRSGHRARWRRWLPS